MLSLAFGYALLLNALLGTSVEGVLAAADPLAGLAASSHCLPEVPTDQPSHRPGDHQPTCPLCGPACPMHGPVGGQAGPGTVAGLIGPGDQHFTTQPGVPTDVTQRRSLYASDTDSQGPPSA